MAAGGSAAGSARGGASIPPARSPRTRLITGLGALAALAGVGGYSASLGGVLAEVGALLAAAGLVFLLVGLLFRVAVAIPWTIALAGGGYLVARVHHRTADGWAALVGAGLLLAAELAAWSIADDRRIHEERAVVVRQAVVVAALVAGSALVGFVLVGAAAVSASAGLALTAAGVAAAVGAVAVVLRLLRE